MVQKRTDKSERTDGARTRVVKSPVGGDDFTFRVRHDLRGPLAVILGYAELLTESHDPDTRNAARVIIQTAHRMNHSINVLLDVDGRARERETGEA